MENKDIHSRIEQSLNSLDRIQRAEANPFLLTRVLEKMKQPGPGLLKPYVVWQIATCMVIVLMLNIGIGFYSMKNQNTRSRSTQTGYFDNHIYTY